VRSWDAATGQETFRKDTTKYSYADDRVSPDGKILAVTPDAKEVVLVEKATGKELHRLGGHRNVGFATPRFAPDGKLLAVADFKDSGNAEGIVHIWDTTTGKKLWQLAGHGSYVDDMAFAPDAQTLVSAGDGMVLWDLKTGRKIHRFAQVGRCWRIAMSPDGKTLAASTYDNTYLFNMATGKLTHTLSNAFATTVAFSPDGRVLAAGNDAAIVLWDAATARELIKLRGHTSRVNSVAFSPDSKRLASGSDDTTILIWDVPAALAAAAVAARARPTAADLDRMWDDLQKADAAVGYQAIQGLLAEPERAVALLKQRLQPAQREEPMPDELRVSVGEPLRGVRAIQVLEQIGTPEARKLLEELSKGSPARLTRDAHAAVRRLDQRKGTNP
jgi:dipeptidyl aminopeptidase/acylaminoacyl peptidase